jgi:hypothetical protein
MGADMGDTSRTTLAERLASGPLGVGDAMAMLDALRGDSQVALDTPTLRWAVAEGIPEGDTGAADEYAASQEATWEQPPDTVG